MMSVDEYGDSAQINIPSSLRTIQPFLDDAQKFIRHARRLNHGIIAINYLKSAISCISMAFKLNAMLNAELSPEDRNCLDDFHNLRKALFRETSDSSSISRSDDELPFYQDKEPEDVGTHELLMAEADYVLNLADEQWAAGLQFEAMLNYHTSCVFYRVMETMVPSKASTLHHSRLLYAAGRTRLASHLYGNFVRENFTGGSCSEVYEVHGSSKLGKGSYGSVYLATHRLTGDERAVKVMNVDRITSYYLRKLHTEIAILKSLDHPNIIKLQDVFFGKRSVYIVTDLCRGGELFELLNSGKNQGFVFREDRASRLMRDMLSAVHYLHDRGIVHRDLKLENFLFEDHAANSPLILIDFGLSKHFSKEGEVLSQKVGSCYYTAPEVLNGCYDYRCDLWSLGVLCYMLLSGSPPFYGKSVEDVYAAILSKEASFADKKFKHVSNACMDFMKRLLVRDPRGRLTTAEALQHPFITGAPFLPRYMLPSASASSSVATGGGSGKGVPRTLSMERMDIVASPSDTSSSLIEQPSLSLAQMTTILEAMLLFAKADVFVQLLFEMVSHSLGSLELQKFREEFQVMDSAHLGSVTRRDFLATFQGLMAVQDLRLLYDTIAVSRRYALQRGRARGGGRGEGKEQEEGSLGQGQGQQGQEEELELTYHEYVAAAMHGRVNVSESRLTLLFTYLDPDRQGGITAASIRSALGEDLPEVELDRMLAAADRDRGGFITKQDLFEAFQLVWGPLAEEGQIIGGSGHGGGGGGSYRPASSTAHRK